MYIQSFSNFKVIPFFYPIILTDKHTHAMPWMNRHPHHTHTTPPSLSLHHSSLSLQQTDLRSRHRAAAQKKASSWSSSLSWEHRRCHLAQTITGIIMPRPPSEYQPLLPNHHTNINNAMQYLVRDQQMLAQTKHQSTSADTNGWLFADIAN